MTATAAAIEAGYSPKSARYRASKLLRKPEIAEAVVEKRTAAQIEAGLSLAHVWKRLGEFIDDDRLPDRAGAVRSAELALRAAKLVPRRSPSR